MTKASRVSVHVVDDDDAVRDSLTLLLDSVGLSSAAYASANEFLSAWDGAMPACLLLDIRMPGMSGLDLQVRLAASAATIPIIFITGHGDVPMAVRAMKAGAFDFIEKPFNHQDLIDRVQQALQRADTEQCRAEKKDELRARLARLTPREHQVLQCIVDGQANKMIASDLKLSERTVELHRSRVMRKTGARSLAELVRLAIDADG